MKCFALLLVILSANVFSSELTVYEKIKRAHEASSKPANISLFPFIANGYSTFSEAKEITCRIVTSANPNSLKQDIRVARYRGPQGDKLMPGLVSPKNTTIYDALSNFKTQTDYVVRVEKNDDHIFSDIGDEVNFYFRQGPKFITFKVQKDQEDTPKFYGVCYGYLDI